LKIFEAHCQKHSAIFPNVRMRAKVFRKGRTADHKVEKYIARFDHLQE